MPSPSKARPETQTIQSYDVDAVTTAGTAATPSKATGVWRSVVPLTSGTLVVDTAGTADVPGSTNFTIPAAALQVGVAFHLLITRIYAASTGTFLPRY